MKYYIIDPAPGNPEKNYDFKIITVKDDAEERLLQRDLKNAGEKLRLVSTGNSLMEALLNMNEQ